MGNVRSFLLLATGHGGLVECPAVEMALCPVFLISHKISSLTYYLFMSVYFAFYMLVSLPDFFLLISYLISL